jgi:hypothetical protein
MNNERFGCAPVRDSYLKMVDEDTAIRDLMFATQVPVPEVDDIEDFEGICIEMTNDGFKTSKGWKEFFRLEI